MKKRYLFSALGVLGASVTGYALKDKKNREMLKEKAKSVSQKIKKYNSTNSTLEDAGRPDQSVKQDLAQFENAKMVSEGSQFGVNYYNEVNAEKQK